MDTEWRAVGARQFVDKRMQFKRNSGVLARYGVRAYKGAIVRRSETGKAEYDSCPHAHAKIKTARQCAEKEARRRNRLLKKAKTEEQTNGTD
jgi:hypothetical protein